MAGQACRVGDLEWVEELLGREKRAKRRTSCDALKPSRGYGTGSYSRALWKRDKRALRDRRSLMRAKEVKIREQLQLTEEADRQVRDKDKLVRRIVNSALIELVTAEETECEGQTPLHLACEFGHLEIVRRMLECIRSNFVLPVVLPFVINYTDQRGWTPLHCAARWTPLLPLPWSIPTLTPTQTRNSMGHLDICQLMLAAGADASTLADLSRASALHMLLRCESVAHGFLPFDLRGCSTVLTNPCSSRRGPVQVARCDRGYGRQRSFHQCAERLRRDCAPL